MMPQFVKARFSAHLRFAIREVVNEWRNQERHHAGVRRAKRLTTTNNGPLRLNLGTGNKPKLGWVNVDLFAPEADVRLDLREPFPFADHSVREIYCEHFFEHLEYPNVADAMAIELEPAGRQSEALGFLRECSRVLVPHGVLDLVVPDVERKIRMYVDRDHVDFPVGERWWGPNWCDTPMHCLNYLFRQGREHKYAYDEDTLRRVLE